MQATNNPHPDVHACEEARRLGRVFVGGAATTAERERLHAHLRTCADCDADYHRLVEGFADMARALRARRSGSSANRAPATPHAPHRIEVWAAEELAAPRRNLLGPGRVRSWRLPRALMLPFFGLLFAIGTFTLGGGQRLRFSALAGQVRLGNEVLAAPAEREELARGIGGSTLAGARALLERGSNRVELEPQTSFVVDRSEGIALRLFEGGLSIEGDAQLVTGLGVVEARAARAVVSMRAGELSLRCTSGSLSLCDTAGTRAVAPGETLVVTRTP